MENTEFEEILPCSEKLAFDTKKAAKGVATTTAYQTGAKLTPYKCQYCKLWHLATDYDN